MTASLFYTINVMRGFNDAKPKQMNRPLENVDPRRALIAR